ncbi:MAG: zinc dependent phospholipase C family protein [Oscillospiraceae bacterium]|nr:zinc dependent phospholipase C family protein [Oscillospiraceae bacterium]
MPEGYTHLRCATKALTLSGENVAYSNLFLAGANGADAFFAYKAWRTYSQLYPMADLGQKLHTQKVNAFLTAMLNHAVTDVQKSYVLGFLTHYALDSLAHPYVTYLCQSENAPYSMKKGHNFYETALDSTLYKKDSGKNCIPVNLSTPPVYGYQLGEICALLRDCIFEVFGEQVPFLALTESFHDFRFVRKFFRSPYGIKKAFAKVIELPLIAKRGFLTSRMQPMRLKRNLPNEWVNTYTNERNEGGMGTLIKVAERTGAAYMKAACAYWNGFLTIEQLNVILGNKSYYTGLPLQDETQTASAV